MSYILMILFWFVVGVVSACSAAVESDQTELNVISTRLQNGGSVTLSASQIDYFQAGQSLNLQWADLTLVDDVTGIGKLMGKLEIFKGFVVPYFYKVSKEKTSFDILGSYHLLPLEILPPFIKEKFKGYSVLADEGRGSEEDSFSVEEGVDEPAFLEFVDRLSPEEQRYLQRLPVDMGKVMKTDVRMMPSLYKHFYNKEKMDDQLVSTAKEQKPSFLLLGLEEGFLDPRRLISDFSEDDSLDEFRFLLQESMRYGGFLNHPNIVFGAGHLWGSKGLFSHFLNDGWKIAPYNKDGRLEEVIDSISFTSTP